MGLCWAASSSAAMMALWKALLLKCALCSRYACRHMLLQNWVPEVHRIKQDYISYGCLFVPGAFNITSAWRALLSLLATNLITCCSCNHQILLTSLIATQPCVTWAKAATFCKAHLQDSTGNWGGSLILSTTTAGSTSSSSGQPVDRLTIDSSGLATFTAGQTNCLLGNNDM